MIVREKHIVLENIEIAPLGFYKINCNLSMLGNSLHKCFYVYKMFTDDRKALHRFYVASTITDFITKIDRDKCAIIITNTKNDLALIRLGVICYGIKEPETEKTPYPTDDKCNILQSGQIRLDKKYYSRY